MVSLFHFSSSLEGTVFLDYKYPSEHENSCIILHQQEMRANIGDSSLEIDSEQNIGSQGLIASKDDCINISLQVRPLSRRVQSAPRNLFNAKMNSKGQR